MKKEYTYQISIRMDVPTSVKYLNDQILLGDKKGYKDFTVIVQNNTTYPNICAPFAGILDYYQKVKDFQFYFEYEDINPYPVHTHFDSPLDVKSYMNSTEIKYPFDKVWRFDSFETQSILLREYILAIRQADIIDEDTILSFEWSLNETMDNILQHSNTEVGYIMAQLHKVNKRFTVCVFDVGQGMYNSLKGSKHCPETPLDAITLALQEKVTRDEHVGQGNGLWGLSRLVSESNGLLRICSAGAEYRINNGDVFTQKEGNFHLGNDHGTTLVDFQLDYSSPINVTKALNGHKPTDFWLEDLEVGEDEVLVVVSEMSSGTGTRKAAEKFRNLVLNLTLSNKKRVILDFAGVNLVSSSYADELIGKIIGQYGFTFFNERFKLKNLTPTNVSVINRSVEQRMAQVYYNMDFVDDEEE